MIVLRSTAVVLALVYLALWGVALSGASSLVPLLLIPLALAVLVAGGNWLSQYMGLPSRSPKYHDPPDDPS